MWRRIYLFVFQWRIRFRHFQEHWHERPFAVVLLYVAIGFLLYWRFVEPPDPGYAVTAIAVVAVAMTFQKELAGKEKLAWLALLVAFCMVEISSIKTDRKDAEKERSQARDLELRAFSTIVSGLQKSIQDSDRHFTETMAKSNQIASSAEENLEAVTGGNSFIEFCVVPNMGRGNPISFPMIVSVYGKYPMRSVSASIQRIEKDRGPEGINRQLASMHNLPLRDGTILPGSKFIPENLVLGSYSIGVWSMTGMITETIDLTMTNSGELDQSYKVVRIGKTLVQVEHNKLIMRRL